MTKPICLWSGPRNVSTALLYSFAQREDIRVVDEPLYGHYLRSSGADHPGRNEIIANMNCDGAAVMRALLARQGQDSSRRLFLKHMAHHLVDLDLGFLNETSNIFLIRDPREMLPSLTVQLPHAELSDTGLKRQWELFDDLRAAGRAPAILDSRELLLDPAGVLTQLCDHLGMDFNPCMLHWEAGPRPEDGIWAPHWYHAVHKSTGFAPYQEKGEFPEELEGLLADCKPWYDKLFENALINGAQGE
ncbi:MAG: sulfotransferase [Gammaproteobacteria bacterium]|nr:sulfotransferase [Gammaproteobacteria bacterium]